MVSVTYKYNMNLFIRKYVRIVSKFLHTSTIFLLLNSHTFLFVENCMDMNAFIKIEEKKCLEINDLPEDSQNNVR